ncbi:MAG: SpoIIE family protein phosphatase [Treponema sp.]|nr:SpoIIE family protein phosphatase [Treponema sp.]
MVYVLLNISFFVFFTLLAIFSIKTFSLKEFHIKSFINALIFFALLSILYAVVVSSVLSIRINQIVGKAVLVFESFALINLSFYFLYHGKHKFNIALLVLKIAFYALACYVIFYELGNASMTTINSPGSIESLFIFSGELGKVFHWKWANVFVVFFRFVLPGFCALVMLLNNEYRGSSVEKLRGYLDASALLVMWFLLLIIRSISKSQIAFSTLPEFSLTYIVSFIFPVLVMFYSSMQKVALTKNEFGVISNRIFFLYIMPATLLGEIYAVLFSIYVRQPRFFIGLLVGIIAATLLFIWYLDFTLENIQYTNSTDYEHGFERELKELNYDSEMDELAEKMVGLFGKYASCADVKLWSNTGKGELKAIISGNNALSSEGSQTVSFDAELFENLLDSGKNIIAFNEVEKEVHLLEIKEKLLDFFYLTNSDVLMLFNEGKNLFSLLTLSTKKNGDHYGSYDTDVFTHLYSYFFVFAYYMQNISNKDIIGTINRELRMSSQIITSIQENIDPIKSTKIDASYKISSAHTIGGEFVDLIRINDTSHLCVIGAVSGRGLAASMSMVILKSVIRTYLSETHDFKKLVIRVNDFIRNNMPRGTIFLGTFALLDFKNDIAYYINCGISAMFLYTKAYDNVIEIQGQGKVLGFVKDIGEHLLVRQIKLNAGDIILACTDGIINAKSLRSEPFGKNRVQRTLLESSDKTSSEIIQNQFDALNTFIAKELENDICLLSLKYAG